MTVKVLFFFKKKICFAGVKATYLLAVAFLEIIRFSSNGGILTGGTTMDAARSAFTCVFEYLKTPNLMPAVFQCLTAIVHRAFETALSWLVGISLTFLLHLLLILPIMCTHEDHKPQHMKPGHVFT